MNVDFENPRGRKARRHDQALKMMASGKVRWTARGIQDGMRLLMRRWFELTDEERKEFDPYFEALYYVTGELGSRRGLPHARRLQAVVMFVQHYHKRLQRDKLVRRGKDGFMECTMAMFEAMAKLPYTLEGFDYEQVKNYVQKSEAPN